MAPQSPHKLSPELLREKQNSAQKGTQELQEFYKRLQAFEELILHNELINYNSKRIADAAPAREIPSVSPWILGSPLCLETLPRDDCE